MDKNLLQSVSKYLTNCTNKCKFILRVLAYLLLHVVAACNFKKKCIAPRNVVIQTHAIHLVHQFIPLVEHLRQEGIEVYFVVIYHPEYPLREMAHIRSYASKKLAINLNKIMYFWQMGRMEYGMLLATYPFVYFPKYHCPRWLFMHGPGVHFNLLRKSIKRKNLDDFDLIMTCGHHDAKILKKYQHFYKKPLNIHTIGLPFLDRLKSDACLQYCDQMSLDRKRNIILFAPSWGHTHFYREVLSEFFTQIIWCLQQANLQVLIKLHAAVFKENITSGVNWHSKLAQIANTPNIHIDYDVDDTNALKNADLLITDTSSRAFNFMLLDKPVVLFAAYKQQAHDIDKERTRLLEQGSLVVNTVAEIVPAVNQALKYPSHLQYQRRIVAEKCFVNFGTAAYKMAKLIANALQ